MGNFLRFAALVLLLLIGFGSGICGLFGLGAVAVDSMNGRRGGPEDFTSVAVVLQHRGPRRRRAVHVGQFARSRGVSSVRRRPMPRSSALAAPPA